jgi:hypothetical protein
MKTLIASLIGLFGLLLLATMVLEDPNDSGSTATEAEREPTATATVSPTSPTSPTSQTSPTSPTSPTSTTSTTTPTSPTATATPTETAASEPRIETSDLFYFGEPYETIQIPGTYSGVDGPARLRLQMRRAAGWTWFPLPVVTQPSGEFRAYVELGAGQYRLRLVDPETGVESHVLTILVV